MGMDELRVMLREFRERVPVAIRMHPDTIEALRTEAEAGSSRVTLAAAMDSPPFYGLPLIADAAVSPGSHELDYADGQP